MRKILVYLAHPRLDRSQIHTPLRPMVEGHHAVTLVDLYAEYPDLSIQVRREQTRLEAHDVIIFEYPMFWYSTPSILKEWQDLVLEYSFAYGKTGDKLRSKAFGQVISTGTSREDYSRKGSNKFEVHEMLTPLHAMANLCGMIYLQPLVIHSSASAHQDGRLEEFLNAYQTYLDALADQSNDLAQFTKREDIVSTIRKFIGV